MPTVTCQQKVSGCMKLSLTPTSLHFFEGAGASYEKQQMCFVKLL